MKKGAYVCVFFIIMLASISSAYATYLYLGVRACIFNLFINLTVGVAIVLFMWMINAICNKLNEKSFKKSTIFLRELGMAVLVAVWGGIYNQIVYTPGGQPVDLLHYFVGAIIGILLASIIIIIRMKASSHNSEE